MLIGKLTKALILALSLITFGIGQDSRDQTIQITFPTTGSVIDTNFVNVTFTVASFFELGDPQNQEGDGYAIIYLDDLSQAVAYSVAPVMVSGIAEGIHNLKIELVDLNGASFSPAVLDTATFTVDMVSEPNLCHPRNLSVIAGDARNFLNWYEPIAMSNLNPFPAVPQSVDYHTGTTNSSAFIASSLIQGHGGLAASKNAGWAIFDIAGLNPNIEVDTIIFNYYVNATNWPYWSATAVNVDPLTASAADVHAEILSGTDLTTAYLYQNESSTFAPGWYSNALINGANDDLEDAIPQGYFVIGITDRDGIDTYFLDIDGWNEANPPSIEIHWSAPGGRQGVYHAPVITEIPYNDDEIMDYKNAISEGLPIPVGLEGIRNYETIRFPNSSPREIIEGCGYFESYEIYTSDGMEVASVDTNYYIHENLINGTEYCYYVIASYAEGSSTPTATVCGNPETFIPAGITNLSGLGLHEEVALSWTDPSVPQYTFYENFNNGMPATWTVTDNNGSGVVWMTDEEGPSGYTLDDFDSEFAIVISNSNTFPNTDLISPSIDLSNYSSATLYYNFNYQDFALNPTDTGSVYISGDGGTTWLLMNVYDDDTPTGGFDDVLSDTVSLDSVVGNPDVRIKFHYEVESGESWFFALDDIIVIGNEISARDMTGSTVSTNNTYIPGNAHNMEFSVNIISPDGSYGDSVAITFPTGVTILAAGPEELGSGTGAYGPEPFNDIDGQTISWGTNANDISGGLFGSLTVWATLSFDSSLSGPLPASYHVSDDWWNTPVDVDGNFDINQRDLVDGNLLGYNIYIDGSSIQENSSLIEQTSYIVTGLTIGQSYTFGVTAAYHPSYESNPMEVTVIPTWLYGDISGTVTDPNSSALDSAIVRVGNRIDTTGADGTYFLDNLEPGIHTISVQRHNFENDYKDVTVIAQSDAVIQDFVLIPALVRPGGLKASAGDHQVDLIWNAPGSSTSYDMAYYDDNLEAQIGCGGGCEFGVRFTPLGYPAALTTLLISVQGDASVINGNVIALVDDAGSIEGPGNLTPVTLATGLNLSSTGGIQTQFEVDVSAAGVVVNSGDIYILIQENNSGFLGIANDIAPQSPEYYDRNWTGLGDGSYSTIFDAVGGDPALTGDFGIMASFDGPTMVSMILNNQNEVVERIPAGSYTGEIKSELDNKFDIESLGYNRGINPENVIQLTDIRLPERLFRSREDSLVGYNVYQAIENGDTLVATTEPGDTTATVTVSANYVEYCYAVKASYHTDNYGIVESKKSSAACAVPYTLGDTDFDSSVSLSDLLAVADYVLEAIEPTEDQFRGADVNKDQMINIQDMVLILDIIYGVNARRIATDVASIAELSLRNGGGTSLLLDLAYDGFVRGIQFDLSTDMSRLSFGSPLLNDLQEGVMINSHTLEDGSTRVLAVNMNGGLLSFSTDGFITVPVMINTDRGDRVKVDLSGVQLIGQDGQNIPVAAKGDGSVALELIPMQYALYQNFPNPFNPVTEIQFDVPDVSVLDLVVYNLMGQQVRRLVNGETQAGYHRVVWDGLNDRGEPVSTGVYIFSLTSPSFHNTKKMVLLK